MISETKQHIEPDLCHRIAELVLGYVWYAYKHKIKVF